MHCLHGELLDHVHAESAVAVAQLLDDCLGEVLRHWAHDGSVRFLADFAFVERWSAVKGANLLSDGHSKAEVPAVDIGRLAGANADALTGLRRSRTSSWPEGH